MRLPGQIAAAIEILTEVDVRHRPVSEALRDWGLSHRFAGAGDRAAIGNLVYDALRRRLSLAWLMGGDTPWHLALGVAIFDWGNAPAALNASFAGDAHAPAPIPDDLLAALPTRTLDDAPDHVRADVPEWIAPHLAASFGESWVAEAEALAGRPPLDLRVNTLKAEREKVEQQIARVGAVPTLYSPVGLRIPPTAGARRHPNVQTDEGFQRGRFEVQDEGSQLVTLFTGAKPGEQVLDLCAGAGGKTLALAALMDNRGQVYATDTDRTRLAPIFDRLKRAGARNVQVRPPGPDALAGLEGQMDRVLVDAPCTGSGVWRRRPDAKWRLTPDALARRLAEQDAALSRAASFVKPGGRLIYATCSLLKPENADRIEAFRIAQPNFRLLPAETIWRESLLDVAMPDGVAHGDFITLTPLRTGTDGFVVSVLERS